MTHVVIVGKEDEVKSFTEKIKSYLPVAEIEIIDPNDEKSIYKQIDNKVTVYICGENYCSPPVNNLEQLEEMLKLEASKK